MDETSPGAIDDASLWGTESYPHLISDKKKQWISQLVCEKENRCEKFGFTHCSGELWLFIVGGMTYVLREIFFFTIPIFGLAAAVLRFGTATLMKVALHYDDDPKKKKEESHDN